MECPFGSEEAWGEDVLVPQFLPRDGAWEDLYIEGEPCT